MRTYMQIHTPDNYQPVRMLFYRSLCCHVQTEKHVFLLADADYALRLKLFIYLFPFLAV